MKKFVFRGFYFISIGLILLFALNALYVRTNGYRSLDDSSKYSISSKETDVINLGSSHARCAFDYSEIDGMNGANLGKDAQSLYFDLEILKKYGNGLPEGSIVIIPISYFSFDAEKEAFNQRTQYYGLLDYGAIPNHDPIEYLKARILPILSAKDNIKYLLWDKDSPEYQQGDEGLDKDDEEAWIPQAPLVEDIHRNTHEGNHQMNKEILGEMIEYCQERGYEPVLLTTPFTRYYNDLFSEEDLNFFYGNIDDIRGEYDISYLDYSHDQRFAEEREYYLDTTHMNTLGAKAFTRIVLSDLGMI